MGRCRVEIPVILPLEKSLIDKCAFNIVINFIA